MPKAQKIQKNVLLKIIRNKLCKKTKNAILLEVGLTSTPLHFQICFQLIVMEREIQWSFSWMAVVEWEVHFFSSLVGVHLWKRGIQVNWVLVIEWGIQ